jgi:hypothetical protein
MSQQPEPPVNAPSAEEMLAPNGRRDTSFMPAPSTQPASGLDVQAFLRAQAEFIKSLTMTNVTADVKFMAAAQADYADAMANALWQVGEQHTLVSLQAKYIELLHAAVQQANIL